MTGQPPQRPPNMGPAQGLAFRGPFPSGGFGLPPRNALSQQPFQGLPGSHRTAGQNMVLPSPSFIQQRGQSGYPFGGGALGQQQSQQTQQHPASHRLIPKNTITSSHVNSVYGLQAWTTSTGSFSFLVCNIVLAGRGLFGLVNGRIRSPGTGTGTGSLVSLFLRRGEGRTISCWRWWIG